MCLEEVKLNDYERSKFQKLIQFAPVILVETNFFEDENTLTLDKIKIERTKYAKILLVILCDLCFAGVLIKVKAGLR